MEFSFLSKYLMEKGGEKVSNIHFVVIQEKNVKEGGFWTYGQFIW